MATTGDRNSTVSPPAGLGSVPGLGEAFRMNLGTGQGVYSYKFPLPEGVAGLSPKLTLEYSHGTRLDLFGLGWRLPLRAIDRRLDTGIPEDGVHEIFLDNNAEIVELADGSFGALSETAFIRYTRAGDGWKIEERDGMVHQLGTAAEARIEDAGHAGRVQCWLIEKTTDVSGNTIDYKWRIDGFAYIQEIRYAAYAIRFIYEDRADLRLDGKVGFLRALKQRCIRIELILDPGTQEKQLRAWALSYDNSSVNGVSMLTAIQMTCFASHPELGATVVRSPVRFKYNNFNLQSYSVGYYTSEAGGPPPLGDPDTALVNLDQAPLPGILQVVQDRQYYWRNNGSGWEPPRSLPPAPFSGSFARAGVAFMDMTGNGKPDLMLLEQGTLPGYYENDGQNGWGRFVAYPRDRRTAPDWTSGRIRVADNDGDGIIDAIESTNRGFVVWRNKGEQGWSDPQLSPRTAGANPADVDFSNPLVLFADMTGDGLSDIVEIASGTVRYWPNLGNGHYGDGIRVANAPRLSDLHRSSDSVFLIDVDGDGCADLVRITTEGVTVAINRNGSAFADAVLLAPIPAPIPGTIRAVNVKGTPAAGLVWNSYRAGRTVGYAHLELSPTAAPYLLSSVDNGSGLVSEFFYRSAVEEYLDDREHGVIWDTNFPFPLLVVKRTRETDQVTGQETEILYRYHNGHYEPRIRRFEGFRTSERIEKGDESRPDTRTVFQFLMAMERVPGNTAEHAALNGSLARIEVYQQDGSPAEGQPYSREESEYELTTLADTKDGRKRSFVKVKVHRMLDIERSNDVRGEEKTYVYDEFGNVVRETHRGFGSKGGVTQSEQIRTIQVAYAKSPTHRLLDKHTSVVVRDGAGKIVSESRFFYDGPDFRGLPLGQADRGLLTRELRLSMSTADFTARFTAGMDGAAALGYVDDDDQDGVPSRFINAERYAYDARGLKIASLDPMGTESRFDYDAAGLLRIQLTDPLGQTKYEYDRSIGQPITITYPDGEIVRFRYDAQGRIISSATPAEDPDSPPRTYSYDDTVVPNLRVCRMRTTRGATPDVEVVTYFDGRGNEYQYRAQMEVATYIVSGRRVYNPWGDVKEEFEPTFSADRQFSSTPVAGKTSRTFRYDARGRVVQSANYSGGISAATYLPFSIETSDANDTDHSAANVARGQFGTPHREEFDVFRQRTAVVEDLGGGQSMTTSYVNDAQGRLLEIHDAIGLVCSYTYDLLGHRYQISHRSAGIRKLWYDARGRVVRSLDASGNDLRVNMDMLGRLRSLSSGGVTLEEYTYETGGGANNLGKVSRVTYRGGAQSLGYDASGRVSTSEYTFDGMPGTHKVQYEYDYMGREVKQTHSDGVQIEKTLTLNGWVKSITGVLSEVKHNPRGLPEKISFSNGVVTELGYLDGPGRVNTQKTTGPHGEVYENLTFDFDLMGLLLSSSDTAPAGRGNVTYAYDSLYQVSACTSSESGAPVTLGYDYFNHLNISRFDEAQTRFQYDDPLHPDRISAITPNGGARQDLSYDASGNLRGLPGRNFTYNEKNELVRVARADGLAADYAYDPHGQRVSKRVTDNHGLDVRTFFIGDSVEISGGNTTHFIYLAQRRVAILGGGQTKSVHSDYAGGTSFFTDAKGVKLAAIAYRPFGNVARSDGAVDLRTYSIHPFDVESGLYYMRRRYYSPDIGRFLSPDPLVLYQPQKLLGNPKALHLYAYVGNDPLNNVDFDGLSFWSVVGAIVGVIVAVALVVAAAALTVATGGAFAVVIGIVLAIGIVSVSYAVASANRGTGLGEFFRGFMIGFNAGLNASIGTMLFGPVIGIALGVINFLAAFDGIAGNKIYQGILGWASWIMPMSWLATAVGLILFVINVIVAGVTFQQWQAAKIDKISIHWETGAIVITGGLIHPLGGSSGFNLGQFAFLSSGSSAEEHETGHGLNVAAFGSIFHFVAAIDQNVFGSGADTYSERLAESHDPSKADPTQWWDMWDPRHA
jgi:RHS repeat-associated protein